jgi:hypothetical protein
MGFSPFMIRQVCAEERKREGELCIHYKKPDF